MEWESTQTGRKAWTETWSHYDPTTGKVRIRFLPREWTENPPDEGITDDLYETADCPLLPELLSWRPFEP